eukprot:645212_1
MSSTSFFCTMTDSHSHVQHHSNYKPNVHTHTLDWVIVAVMGLMIIALIGLNISLAPKLQSYFAKFADHTAKRNKTTTYSIASIVLLTLSAICTYVSTILILIYSDFHHELIINDILTKASLCLYCGCQTLMIYVFTLRVDTLFSGTEMVYSQNTMRSLYASCVIFSVLYIFLVICHIFELWSIYYVVAIVWIAIYFSLSLLLCVLFVRKLEVLMLMASRIDKDLLHIILKSIILVSLSIASSFIFFTVMMVMMWLSTPGEWHAPAVFWNVVDCTVSEICLCLLFASNDPYYAKYCGCVHSFCEKREIKGMEKKMTDIDAGRVSTTKTDVDATRTSNASRLENVVSDCGVATSADQEI